MKNQLFVAIVCNDPSETSIIKRPGAVTGPSKTLVIENAIKMRDEWQARGNGPYRILLGELNEEVVSPIRYEVVSL